ncbi:MAG: GNAT family N-acetyltransferase [Clostridiales bacterium]|nr:GNAT family N-acetyltransferase [Clostridiales bacterium]
MLTLTASDRSRISEHKRLYRSAFPLNERFPWHMLVKRAKAGKAELLTLDDDGKNTGFAYVITNEYLAYLFFFAVRKDCRGKGIGTEAIKLLIRRYSGKRLFLAIEPLDETSDNYDERVKRHGFYLNSGLIDLPCRLKEFKMIYSVMSAGSDIPAGDFRSMMDSFFGKLINRILDVRIIES